MKNRLFDKIIKTTLVVTFTITCLSVNSIDVAAGGINAEEARIINAISQIYRYEDGLYAVGGEYQEQVASKLSQPNINLSASDVNGYLNIFYANIDRGVAEGYMFRVGDYIDPNAPATPTVTPDIPQDTPQENQTPEAGDSSSNDDSQKKDTEKKDTDKKDSEKKDTEKKDSKDTDTKEKITDYVDVEDLDIDPNLKLSDEELKLFYNAEKEKYQEEEPEAEETETVEKEAKDYSNASPLNNNKGIAKIAVAIVIGLAIVVVGVTAFIKSRKSKDHKRNNR